MPVGDFAAMMLELRGPWSSTRMRMPSRLSSLFPHLARSRFYLSVPASDLNRLGLFRILPIPAIPAEALLPGPSGKGELARGAATKRARLSNGKPKGARHEGSKSWL